MKQAGFLLAIAKRKKSFSIVESATFYPYTLENTQDCKMILMVWILLWIDSEIVSKNGLKIQEKSGFFLMGLSFISWKQEFEPTGLKGSI